MSNPPLRGSRLALLLAGRERPHKTFVLRMACFDGDHDVTLAVRALSAEELIRSRAEATKWLVSTGGWLREDLLGDAGDFAQNLELMVQQLALALVDPEKPSEPLAADAAELRRRFTVDELRACMDSYNEFQQERSPFMHLATMREAGEVADAAGKGLITQTAWLRYANISLRAIITTLVDRVATRTTPRSSDTSSPSDSPESSSAETTPAEVAAEAPTPALSVTEEPIG